MLSKHWRKIFNHSYNKENNQTKTWIWIHVEFGIFTSNFQQRSTVIQDYFQFLFNQPIILQIIPHYAESHLRSHTIGHCRCNTFTGQMLFLSPTNSVKALEGIIHPHLVLKQEAKQSWNLTHSPPVWDPVLCPEWLQNQNPLQFWSNSVLKLLQLATTKQSTKDQLHTDLAVSILSRMHL